MRSKPFTSAILVSTLAIGLATPVMAGGLHHHPWHHKRDVAVPVVVEPAPVVRYRVTERIIIREVTPGTATRAITSPQSAYSTPQVTYREILSTPSANADVRVVRVDRSISAVPPPAQERATTSDDEAQALERLQNKIAEAAKAPMNTRDLGSGGAITDNDLVPAPR